MHAAWRTAAVYFMFMSQVALSAPEEPAGAVAPPALGISPQGILIPGGADGWTLSPAGTYRMRIVPTGGDFHRIVADLIISGPGGEAVLSGVEGTAFLISDAGRVVVITTDHPREIPSRIAVLDLAGEVRVREEVYALSDPLLSSDGLRLACRGRDGVLLLDLLTGDRVRHPLLAAYAAGPRGLLAGVLPDSGGTVALFGGGERLATYASAGVPRKLAYSADGTALFAIERTSLTRIDIAGGRRSALYEAAPGETLRDLDIEGAVLRLGIRLSSDGSAAGIELRLDSDGRVLDRVSGPARRLPPSAQAPEAPDLGHPDGRESSRGAEGGSRETIAWPIMPHAQHAVGNTYGEFQNYGSSYLHPGVDVFGDPGQPVYAVASGVVKAVLTTDAIWHWRVAVGQPGSGTSDGYLYAHLDEWSIAVDVGDPVVAGQYLGDLVEWPSYDFTHCHFARIRGTGAAWYGDWLCIGNPHLDIAPQTETQAPVFEPAVSGQTFAFCSNQTSTYQNPQALHGAVDIIAHVGDRILSDWVCSVQELRYTIYPAGSPQFPVVDDKLAVFFDMDLDTYSGGPIDPFLVGLLYKRDAVCHTDGDYESREFYHVLTNSDGDQVYETADLWEAWDTSGLPDRDYIIQVTATDVAGNPATASMQVTTDNGNETAAADLPASVASIALHPNPTAGGATLSWSLARPGLLRIELFDPAGRRVRGLADGLAPAGAGSLVWDGNGEDGLALPAGVYLVRMAGPHGVETVKLLRLR